METQLEELAGDRVRLTVDVPSADVRHAVEHAASDLAGSLKIPGFRRGKVPLPVLMSRVGRERLYSEAVESHIGGWFRSAAVRSRIHPIEQPELDYDLPRSADDPFQFTATVAVQPKPELPDWTQLEVPYAEPELPEGLVEHELDVLRNSVAELSPVEGRPAQPGDTLVVDLVARNGESHRDYVVELGAGRLVEELEEGLAGMSEGETKTIEFELGDESRTGVEATVKEIKEKVLPLADDELARAASEFETIDELRAEIESRLRAALAEEADAAFRAAAVDAVVDGTKIEPSGPLVDQRTTELVAGLARSLERRGISLETYLQVTGADANELQQRLRAEATRAVARELVLESAAAKLGVDVSDEEVRALVREQAEAAGEDPEAAVEAIFEHGTQERLREDLRLKAALDRIASEVKRIPVEQARAREAIWTPEKETPPTETKLWTPASKETD